MNGIFWIVLGGMTGWLTGTLMGKEGYGKRSLGGYTRSLDIFFGVVGDSIGGFFFFLGVMGGGGVFFGVLGAPPGCLLFFGFFRVKLPGTFTFFGGGGRIFFLLGR